MRSLAGVLALLTLAGCLAPAASDDVGPTSAAVPLADPLAALDAGEPRSNLHLLGAWSNGNGAEVAAHGDLLYVMRAGAVQVLDVADPAEIKEVAVVKGAHGVLDVKVSDDGKYIFVGDDQEASIAPLAGNGPLTGGLYVYDVEDPKSAELVAYLPVGPRRGPHMVFYHRYPDGREVVFGANADVSISVFDRAAGTLTEASRYQADIVTAFNRDPMVFDVLYQGWAHDMFVQTEPGGRVLMYVANWDAGLRVVDVSDPAAPKEVGGWNDFPDGHSGNLHTVSADWIDGRRIVVGAVEVGFAVVGGIGYAQGAEPGVVYVWDATDPAAIELLGQWENPMGVKAGGRPVDDGVMSTHNLQLEDGRVYLAHYGLGAWVLDVASAERWAEPTVLAYDLEETGSVWDVVVHRGVMWTSGGKGIVGLHFVQDALGAEGISSRA